MWEALRSRPSGGIWKRLYAGRSGRVSQYRRGPSGTGADAVRAHEGAVHGRRNLPQVTGPIRASYAMRFRADYGGRSARIHILTDISQIKHDQDHPTVHTHYIQTIIGCQRENQARIALSFDRWLDFRVPSTVLERLFRLEHAVPPSPAPSSPTSAVFGQPNCCPGPTANG